MVGITIYTAIPNLLHRYNVVILHFITGKILKLVVLTVGQQNNSNARNATSQFTDCYTELAPLVQVLATRSFHLCPSTSLSPMFNITSYCIKGYWRGERERQCTGIQQTHSKYGSFTIRPYL